MKRLTVAAIFAALMLVALPASAHAWSGVGDCDGWTLTLDGLWGAQRIEVDGVDYGRQTTITIPDSSDATSRRFEVRWVKQGPDTVQSRTITRPGGCTPTTTQPTTTTTEVSPSSTTTTQAHQESSTTTIPEETPTTVTTVPSTQSTAPTTTEPSSTSTGPVPTTATPTSTIPPEGSATSTPEPQPTVVTTEPTTDTLPRTGAAFALAWPAVAALLAGAGLIGLSRKGER